MRQIRAVLRTVTYFSQYIGYRISSCPGSPLLLLGPQPGVSGLRAFYFRNSPGGEEATKVCRRFERTQSGRQHATRSGWSQEIAAVRQLKMWLNPTSLRGISFPRLLSDDKKYRETKPSEEQCNYEPAKPGSPVRTA